MQCGEKQDGVSHSYTVDGTVFKEQEPTRWVGHQAYILIDIRSESVTLVDSGGIVLNSHYTPEMLIFIIDFGV